jgi:hypothetical protein
MQGKINENGHLEIKRGKVIKEQTCPMHRNEPYCGDWCPQFGEPQIPIKGEDTWSPQINICQGRCLYFSELTDERES